MARFRLVVVLCTLLPRSEAVAQTLALVQRHAFAKREGPAASPVFVPGDMLGNVDDATVTTNNLGGMGPVTTDPPVITFKNAFTVGSLPITVVVSNQTAYAPADQVKVARNGRNLDGMSPFGMINLKCDTSTQIRFSFEDSTNGSPVTLETVYFTMLDLDSGNQELVKEYMGVLTPFVAHYLSDPTELESYSVSGWGGTAWISTEPGGGSNNPTNAMALTPDQKSRAVMVQLSNVSAIDTLMGLTYREGCKGRNILFSFMSNLDKTESPTPSPTPAPTAKQTEVTCGTCVIWGDPHIITFEAHHRRLSQHPHREEFFRTRAWESDQINVNEAGRYWLVKNDRVKIQGHYEKNGTSGQTFLASLVVGGAFLEGHVLNIQPLSGRTTWEGGEILQSIPSVFKNEFVHATYHNAAKMVKDGTAGPGIDVALPMGVTLTVNRWKHMLAAEISMCPTEDQSGQCNS